MLLFTISLFTVVEFNSSQFQICGNVYNISRPLPIDRFAAKTERGGITELTELTL